MQSNVISDLSKLKCVHRSMEMYFRNVVGSSDKIAMQIKCVYNIDLSHGIMLSSLSLCFFLWSNGLI